jgi:nucleoside-diphosphate-sugar epimerase
LVRNAHAGERMVPTVMAGRTMWVVGDPDAPHSWTYVPDLADAMIRAADDERLWNGFLLAPTAPAISQRDLVATYAEAAGVAAPAVHGIPTWTLHAVGAVHRDTREMAEMSFQFARPFTIDSSASEERLGLRPTPLADGARETVGWWRQQAVAGR